MALTITEALAELKTIDKRLEKKQEFVVMYSIRQEALKDPLEKAVVGGSPMAIKNERQAISDLLERKIKIRRLIQEANASNQITIGTESRSIADWLVWRRDSAPIQQRILTSLSSRIRTARDEAQKRGMAVVVSDQQATKPTDILVNVNEAELMKDMERHEEILGTLDGQLSLKNATVVIEV
jgi:hypothetical protein